DVTLRVNLKDGGANGVKCIEKDIDPDPKFRVPMKICPWDKIPENLIKKYGEPIKTRTKSFEELKNMALEGVSKYWSRKLTNTDGGTIINGESYEIVVNAVQDDKGMKAPEIIYFTNSKETNFTRSHNWELSRKLFYKIGFLKFSRWEYLPENKGIIRFIETSAHEMGHEILLAYGGQMYSKKHKETSSILQNITNKNSYPKKGEIDLMKYYKNSVVYDYYDRVVASKEDALSLIWLTKLELK
ncbi:MAG: hypothetical protein L3J23_09445, partial [Flavobacteriaceae bacterium]|nr:hypothetical protein [Flavobacteriaceae bacterium]